MHSASATVASPARASFGTCAKRSTRAATVKPMAVYDSNKDSSMLGNIATAASKFAVIVAASAALAGATTSPSNAALDESTYKAGAGAKIEYSDIGDQSPADIVRSLKEEVLPQVMEKLGNAASKSGSGYPDSVVQELETVKTEIEALEKQLIGGANSSNIKSAASSIEQQINALKANLGFD